jgi:predicted secreted protein
MALPTTTRGGKVRVLLDLDENATYTAPCGFNSKSVTLSKGLEEILLSDCESPDDVPWIGRDAVSLSMSVSGEGVLAKESKETWLTAFHQTESVPAKVEIEWSDGDIDTWTGNMHVESLEIGAQNGRRVTLNASLQSDGEMVRTVVS